MGNNADYYVFLDFVDKMAKKQKSIQRDSAKIVFENFHLQIILKELDIEIQRIKKLLSN
ncbi:MAG: hypothetical protein ACFE8E_04465 [Candidatus Hodarchaeota archaeon]